MLVSPAMTRPERRPRFDPRNHPRDGARTALRKGIRRPNIGATHLPRNPEGVRGTISPPPGSTPQAVVLEQQRVAYGPQAPESPDHGSSRHRHRWEHLLLVATATPPHSAAPLSPSTTDTMSRKILPGRRGPLGATWDGDGVNFAIF